MIVTDERVARFLSDRTEKAFCPPYTVMGWERDGEIVSAVLFNGFEPPNVHVSVAGDFFPMSFVKALGEYVFSQLGCIRATIVTEQSKVVDLAHRLGGKTEGIIRNNFGKGRDGIIVGILKEDYKFTRGNSI